RRGIRKAGDQPEPRLAHSRPDAVDKGELPDRRVDAPFINGLLHLVQDRLTFLMIELDRLLLVHFVEIGVIPVNKDPAFDDMGFEAGRSIAERRGPRLNYVLERLFGISPDEGRPLDRPKPWPG